MGDFERAWKYNGVDPDNVKVNFEITLAHELFHGYQFEIGALNGMFLNGMVGKVAGDGVKINEAQAVGFENYIRYKLFENTKYDTSRATYGYEDIDEFWEPADWYDYVLGFDKYKTKEFDIRGKVYDIWKNKMEDYKKNMGNLSLSKKI